MTDDSQDPSSEPAPEDAPDTSGDLAEQPLTPWASAAQDGTWTPIEVEGESVPAADPVEPEPITSAGRSRRPTSIGLPPVTERSSNLRASIRDSLTTAPPRPFARGEVSGEPEPSGGASAVQSTHAASASRSTGSAGPAEPPTFPPLVERIVALSSERPEVLLGAAFVGGVFLATILKRFARR